MIHLPTSAFTSDHTDRYYPWMVKLTVVENGDGDSHAVVYYVRAPKSEPGKSMAIGERLWNIWEKGPVGGRYPDVLDHGHARAIDEGDWREAWKAAKKFKEKGRLRYVTDGPDKSGRPPENPMAFTVIGEQELI